MNIWDQLAIAYGVIAIVTLIPALLPFVRDVKLRAGDVNFSCPAHFSDAARIRWDRYCSEIPEVIRSWKKKEEIYDYFHKYCAFWPLFTSISVLIVGARDVSGEAKWLIVVLSGHATLALGIHKAFNIGTLLHDLKKYRGEIRDLTHAYQHNSRMDEKAKDAQRSDYSLEDVQLRNYIEAVDDIQKKARASEVANLPHVEHGNSRGSSHS